jgi:hypothetical protein
MLQKTYLIRKDQSNRQPGCRFTDRLLQWHYGNEESMHDIGSLEREVKSEYEHIDCSSMGKAKYYQTDVGQSGKRPGPLLQIEAVLLFTVIAVHTYNTPLIPLPERRADIDH